jgi:hypothetical protein
MPNETLIAEIENLLAEVVSLGGQNERSQIVPNLTVQDASPTGLDGYVIVSDDRDGDNILARKVGSVVYANNDLVNVMFLDGTEAIAFQQGSGSSNSGIWEIVPSTSTDIFYDKGNVGVGTATPGEQLDVAGNITLDQDIIHRGDTNTLITFTDDKISFDAGGLNLLALTETAQNIVEIGDVAGGGDVDIDFNNGQMFLRGSDGHVSLGDDASPIAASILNIQDDQNAATRVQIRNATAGTAAQAQMRIANDGNLAFQCGITSSTFTTSGELDADNAFFQALSVDLLVRATGANNMKFGTNSVVRMYVDSAGDVGIGVGTAPQARFHVYDAISGFILWEYDGLDATVRTVIANGTGDVLYRLTAMYVLRDSAAAVASGTTDVSNAASVNLTVGGNTVRLRVNADGSCDVARTAGTDTIKVALALRWL